MQGSNGERDIENRLMDMGRGEERVRCMERVTYITICKIDSQWEFAAWLRKLNQGLCVNLEGWDGEGDERGLRKGMTEDEMAGWHHRLDGHEFE